MKILLHEGLSHWVGVVMDKGKGQTAWYPRCMVDAHPRGQRVRIALDAPPAPFIALDAPPAPFITCVYCMTK